MLSGKDSESPNLATNSCLLRIIDSEMEPVLKCILCQGSGENITTGPLSTKGELTAHQNCLLYSSGLFCHDSPLFDDLFGFSVKDVQSEKQRGLKLTCSQCKKKGATVGCEIRKCKKCYHYPCAVDAGAKTFEDKKNGTFGIYCVYCWERKSSKPIHTSSEEERPGTSGQNTKRKLDFGDRIDSYVDRSFGPRADFSVNTFFERLDVVLHYVTFFEPIPTGLRAQGKTRLGLEMYERKSSSKFRRILSSNETEDSDVTDAEEQTNWFQPLESDCSPEEVSRQLQPNRSPPAVSASRTESENQEPQITEDAATPVKHAGTNTTQQNGWCKEELDTSFDSCHFWRECASAGCAQAIFKDFIDKMTDIFTRISSGQSSSQDCDTAFKVILASGKLQEIVAKQQTNLRNQRQELQKAESALDKALLLLK